MIARSVWCAAMAAVGWIAPSMAQTAAPNVRILLPERPRLLEGQQVDLVLEVRNAAAVSNLKVTAGAVDLTSKFRRLPVILGPHCWTLKRPYWQRL